MQVVMATAVIALVPLPRALPAECDYTYYDLNPAAPAHAGPDLSYGEAVNNQGYVAGYGNAGTPPVETGLLWQNPTHPAVAATILSPLLAGGQSQAVALSNLIQGNLYVVGNSASSAGNSATIWLNGFFNAPELLPSGGVNAFATSVNDGGFAAGYTINGQAMEWFAARNPITSNNLTGIGGAKSRAAAIDNNFNTYYIFGVETGAPNDATVWPGQLAGVAMGQPAANDSLFVPYAVNVSDQVAGSYNGTAAIWSPPTPNAPPPYPLAGLNQLPSGAVATAINASGHAVIDGNGGAWLYNGKLPLVSLASCAPAGYSIGQVNGINDSGWIVGAAFSTTGNGNVHAFLLVPAEPAPTDGPLPLWTYVLLALVMIQVVRRQANGSKVLG